MKQSLVQSVWFVFLLILAFVPIFGILPGVYLLVTSQHAANLQPMKGWIKGALVTQGCYVVALLLIAVFFVPR